jgi:polysaccharide pyruvyl transferase WcaK-like protein
MSAWIDTIRRKKPGAKIYCDGYHLENLRALLGKRAHVVTPEQSLWSLREIFAMGSEKPGFAALRRRFRDAAALERTVATMKSLKPLKIEQIHIIGGGYFNSLWPVNYALLCLARLAAWQFGARLVATGQGLTPTRRADASALASILATFDHVDLRDDDSYALLARRGLCQISMTGDDALLHFSAGHSPPIDWRDEPVLVLCLQRDLFPGARVMKSILSRRFLRSCAEAGMARIVFAAAMADDVKTADKAGLERLREAGMVVETLSPRYLYEKGFPLSKRGLVISSRYHPHFFAALSGVRGVALAATDYYATKHDAVLKTGSNWPVLRTKKELDRLPEMLTALLKEKAKSFRPADKAAWVLQKSELADRSLSRAPRAVPFPIDQIGSWNALLQQGSEKKGR